jgi:hypothetical protein
MSKPSHTMSNGLNTASDALTATTTTLMTGDIRHLKQLQARNPGNQPGSVVIHHFSTAEKFHIRYTQSAPDDANLLSLERGLSSFWSSANTLSVTLKKTLLVIEQFYIKRKNEDGFDASTDVINHLIVRFSIYERWALTDIKDACKQSQYPDELQEDYRNTVFTLRDRLRFWAAACKTHHDLWGVIGKWGPDMRDEANRQGHRLLKEWLEQTKKLPRYPERYPHDWVGARR